MIVLEVRRRGAHGRRVQSRSAQIDELEVAVIVDAHITGLDVVHEQAALGRMVEAVELPDELGRVLNRATVECSERDRLLGDP